MLKYLIYIFDFFKEVNKLHRFYTENIRPSDKNAVITGDDVKHMRKVLRLKEGDEITLCDFNKTDYLCKITAINEKEVNLSVLSACENRLEPPVNITLFQGLPKSDKLEYIIQKCVEIGVMKIVPTITKRSVVKISDGEKKRARWQKIADEAAKQCGRGKRVEILPPVSFENAVLSVESGALKLMPYENEEKISLKTILKNSDKNDIAVFIGPEGGFDTSEVEFAAKNGVQTVTLGPRILRTETAPVAVISACMYEKGGWER